MKTVWLIFVALSSGAIAGAFFGFINLTIAEPFVDKAIGYEIQKDQQAGHSVDQNQLADYRAWQKSGEVVSAIILGVGLSAVLGIVFAYARKSLPGSNNTKKAVFLAGVMWFTLFFVTSLKYPANPPAVESPNASIYYRQLLYVTFLSISGLGALGSVVVARLYSSWVKPVVMIPLVYAGIVVVAYFALPPNGYRVPDQMSVLVQDFRIVSGVAMGLMWGVMGLAFGLLWERFKPHLERNQRLTTT